MPRTSEEFKAKVVEKMMPRNARRVVDVHRGTGVSEPTLRAWRREFQNRGHADPANPESWSGRDKLAMVIETASLFSPFQFSGFDEAHQATHYDWGRAIN